jgi:hypothetical protein
MKKDFQITLRKQVLENKKILIIVFIILFCCIGLYVFYPRSNVLSAPAYLQKGDLLFCDYDPEFESFIRSVGLKIHHPFTPSGAHNDHVAMYIGNDVFVEACPYFYDGKKASWTGVVTTHMATFNLWAENITFGLLSNVTDEQRDAAVSWALDQLGQPYQDGIFPNNADPNDEHDEKADQWYCAELIWAAYLNQGVDLNTYFIVSPNSLLEDDDIMLRENKVAGLWYPGMYVQWYGTCFFDYIFDVIYL